MKRLLNLLLGMVGFRGPLGKLVSVTKWDEEGNEIKE